VTPAVFFDFDGVIADTERLHLEAIRVALSPHGVTLDTGDYMATYLGFTDRELLEELSRRRRLDWSSDDINGIMTAKRRAYDALVAGDSVVYPAAVRCVERLAAANVRLAIASGAFAEEIDSILHAAGLRRHFSTIVGAGDYARGKPHPEPYLEAARRLDVRPADAVAIEDSQWGLDAARHAGCATIAVTNTYPRTSLIADQVVDSLDEVGLDLLRSAVSSRR